MGANLLWLESELDRPHCFGTHSKEFDYVGGVDIRELAVESLEHAQFPVEDGCVVGVRGDAATDLCKVVDAAETRVFDGSSFDMHGLEFRCVLLVSEGDGDTVGLVKLRIEEGQHFAISEEPYAT